MLENPTIQEWLDKLQGRPRPAGGIRPGRPTAGEAEQSLAGIVRPQPGAFGFRAPEINARFHAAPPASNPPERGATGVTPPGPVEGRGGSLNYGGAARAAGLQKLGQGIEQALGDIKAKQDQAKEIAAMSNIPPLPPLRPMGAGFPVQAPPDRPGGLGIGVPTPPPRPIFSQPGVGPSGGTGSYAPLGQTSSGGWPSVAEAQAYAEQIAAKNGIEPGRLSALVGKEYGGPGRAVGDQGSSFGPLQLHYGGDAPGVLSHAGMGDDFTKATGLDASDPANWQASMDFAASQIPHTGWAPWTTSAFTKLGWGPREGIGTAAPSQVASGTPPVPPARPDAGGGPGTETGLYGGQPYSYATPGGPNSASGFPGPAVPPSGAATVPVPAPPQPSLINGGQPGVYSAPDQQGMLAPPSQQDMLASALAQGQGQAPPPVDPGLLAMILGGGATPGYVGDAGGIPAAPSFDFGGFGGLLG
jgi:hypothetical protein